MMQWLADMPLAVPVLVGLAVAGWLWERASKRASNKQKARHDVKVLDAKATLREDELGKIQERISQYLAINRETPIKMVARVNKFERLEVVISTIATDTLLTRDDALHHIGAVTSWADYEMYVTQGVNSWTAEKRER